MTEKRRSSLISWVVFVLVIGGVTYFGLSTWAQRQQDYETATVPADTRRAAKDTSPQNVVADTTGFAQLSTFSTPPVVAGQNVKQGSNAQLLKAVEKEFQAKQSLQEAQLNLLAERIKELQRILEYRSANRSQIIEKRLLELSQNEAKESAGTAWDSENQTQSYESQVRIPKKPATAGSPSDPRRHRYYGQSYAGESFGNQGGSTGIYGENDLTESTVSESPGEYAGIQTYPSERSVGQSALDPVDSRSAPNTSFSANLPFKVTNLEPGEISAANNTEESSPNLRAYKVSGVSIDVIESVLQTVLENESNLRLAVDADNSLIIVFGNMKQHAKVASILNGFEQLRSMKSGMESVESTEMISDGEFRIRNGDITEDTENVESEAEVGSSTSIEESDVDLQLPVESADSIDTEDEPVSSLPAAFDETSGFDRPEEFSDS
ncbi:MAG: hypothetical protein AAF483_20845, partial [Planctomycetota bacterium]